MKYSNPIINFSMLQCFCTMLYNCKSLLHSRFLTTNYNDLLAVFLETFRNLKSQRILYMHILLVLDCDCKIRFLCNDISNATYIYMWLLSVYGLSDSYQCDVQPVNIQC